jgi:hypothetical protein
MFKGTVNFRAKIKGNGLTFPLVEFNCSEPGVDKVEIEGPNGDAIHTTVYLASAASHDEGRALATKVNTAALNRISFCHNIAIENARSTDAQFSPIIPQPGVIAGMVETSLDYGWEIRSAVSLPAAQLKAELEQPSLPGENNYGLFCSALQSISPVEEFLHLYNILQMIYNDKQAQVDSFIISEDPAVPQTQHPEKRPGVMETVYTRLRNEFAHRRAGVNLDNTKSEMANRLGRLIGLTKRAIELNP